MLSAQLEYQQKLSRALFFGMMGTIFICLIPRPANAQSNTNSSVIKVHGTTGKVNPNKVSQNRKCFQFIDCELGDIINELGKWYRVKVEFEDGSPIKKRFYADEVRKNWSLEKVVSILVRTGDIRIKLESDCLTLLK